MALRVSQDLTLKGIVIDPEVYLKVINHDLRKKVLHELFKLSINGPITKNEIADNLGIGYHQMLYQLNEHLNYFWTVDHEEKIRGAREEYIRPKNINTVYCLLGSDAAVHVLDPLANLYGKLAKTGVRCDDCPQDQLKRCQDSIKARPCMPQTDEVQKRKQVILMVNERAPPYKPMDQFLVCTLIKSLDNEPSALSIECPVYVDRALKEK